MPIIQPDIEPKVARLRAPLRLVRAAAGDNRPARALDIGLINNMPDAALQATERQFLSLLNMAAGRGLVRLRFFRLPGVPRAAEASARLDAIYGDIRDLMRAPLDGLIVTGTEPRAADLRDEPYWPALAEAIDWAQANTLSTIFSCLAAHAAVLHQDGVVRRPLPQKCFGLFSCEKADEHPLLADLSFPLRVPHSRHNGLSEADLAAAGYRVLTRAGEAGPDVFVRERGSLFVYLQGHPEYGPEALPREFRRDAARFLSGERETFPTAPAGLDEATMARLLAFRRRAEAERDPALIDQAPVWTPRLSVTRAQREAAAGLFRNWLALLAERKPR